MNLPSLSLEHLSRLDGGEQARRLFLFLKVTLATAVLEELCEVAAP